MATHTIAPGATVSDVKFTTTFNPGAAVPRLEFLDKPDPFEWRLTTGKPDPTSGPIALVASVSFVPKGVPPGVKFGLKQVAFHKGQTASYDGNGFEDGSIVAGSTNINFRFLLDLAGKASGRGFSAPSSPFFSSKPIAVANNTTGTIEMKDSPGGAQRLVRSNLTTVKRNFLINYSSATDFVTFLVVELADASHIPLEGFGWKFRDAATLRWKDGKPSLDSVSGDASFFGLLTRNDIADDRLKILSDNTLGPSDCIGFQANNGMILAEEKDAATPPRSSSSLSKDDILITSSTFSITHSPKSLSSNSGR
jgi:hypothetical protein